MTLAICIYCGEKKFGAWTPCTACGRRPTGVEDIARSVTLSDQHLAPQGLEMAQQAVKTNYPWYEEPNIKRVLDHYRAQFSNEKGELDLSQTVNDIKADYQRQMDELLAESDDSGSQEEDPFALHDDPSTVELSARPNRGLPTMTLGRDDNYVSHAHRQNAPAPHVALHDDQQTLSKQSMTALCVFCGAPKVDPIIQCSSCRQQPKDLDAVAKSMLLTQQYLNGDARTKIQDLIQRGVDWTQHPKTQQLLKTWRSRLADDQGELDLRKLVKYGKPQAPPQSVGNVVSTVPLASEDVATSHSSRLDSDTQSQELAFTEPDENPWSPALNILFNLLSVWFPLGMLIGAIGMLVRGNRKQCVALWDDANRGWLWMGLAGSYVGITHTDMMIPYVLILVGSKIVMQLIRNFGLKTSKASRYVAVTLSAGFCCISTVGLVVCLIVWIMSDKASATSQTSYSPTAQAPQKSPPFTGNPNPLNPATSSQPQTQPTQNLPSNFEAEQTEVLDYCKVFLPQAAAIENEGLSKWAKLVEADIPLESCVIVIERDIQPALNRYLRYLESHYPQTPSLREVHMQFVNNCKKRIGAFQQLCVGIRNRDEQRIQLSSQIMQQLDSEVLFIGNALKQVTTKYNLVQKQTSSQR